ncbi:hypothetical protein Psi02_62120 [Planotetraspora silvatica]|uniref:Uncharacterized protein n=1 Tax=Planotetraspora silvatica TaxID=234614 RepID=A0A8J3XUS1_9ACTN|nr:hypothetical protein Psi02_62120 [Planotetraspora silvatica]
MSDTPRGRDQLNHALPGTPDYRHATFTHMALCADRLLRDPGQDLFRIRVGSGCSAGLLPIVQRLGRL